MEKRSNYSRPDGASKSKAWMAHDKSKNGYIVRTSLYNGYKAYRATWIGGLGLCKPATDHRHVDLWGNHYSFRPNENTSWSEAESSAPVFPRATPGSPRRPSSLAATRDDPVLDGQELAADRRTELPLDLRRTTERGVKVSRDAEEKEIADLRRQGLLYDDENPEADLELGDILREEPAYSVRHVARRGTREKAVPDRGGVELVTEEQLDPDEEEEKREDEEGGEETDGDVGMLFVPESEFECWAEFAEKNGFDVVMVDDLVSNAESWVEVDGLV